METTESRTISLSRLSKLLGKTPNWTIRMLCNRGVKPLTRDTFKRMVRQTFSVAEVEQKCHLKLNTNDN